MEQQVEAVEPCPLLHSVRAQAQTSAAASPSRASTFADDTSCDSALQNRGMISLGSVFSSADSGQTWNAQLNNQNIPISGKSLWDQTEGRVRGGTWPYLGEKPPTLNRIYEGEKTLSQLEALAGVRFE